MPTITATRPIVLTERDLAELERQAQQRAEALRKADEIRLRHAEVRRELAALRTGPLREVLERAELERMPVFRLLTGLPKVGPSRASTVLRRARVNPRARLGELTDRQRLSLVAELRAFPAIERVLDGLEGTR